MASKEDMLRVPEKKPVYGEGMKTYEEEGRPLKKLQEELESGNITLIGSSIVGSEVSEQVQSLINDLNDLEQLGSSIFTGDGIEMETEDGGILVIGDDCVIYNTKIKVAKGCTLLLEKVTLLGCEVIIDNGEHRIIDSYLKECKVYNSSLQEVEADQSGVSGSLVRRANLVSATLNSCVGSMGGSEVGGIYINKSFSYYLNPEYRTAELKIEDIAAVNPHAKHKS